MLLLLILLWLGLLAGRCCMLWSTLQCCCFCRRCAFVSRIENSLPVLMLLLVLVLVLVLALVLVLLLLLLLRGDC